MANQSFISKLLRQEGINIEFKKEFELGAVLKSICAFLNSEGGWILIGYSRKKVYGISDNIDRIIEDLENNVANEISPQPLVYINEEVYKNKNLILINILKGSRQPYSFNGKYYIREGRTTVSADADDISLLLRTSNSHRSIWEKMNVTDATKEDLQKLEIEKTIKEAIRAGKGKNLPDTVEGFLSYFQLQDYSFIRNGAMVLFGKEPVRYIPQCRIILTVMPYGKTGNQYSDTLLIEDNLFSSFNKLSDYFTKNLPLINEFEEDDWTRIVREKFPKQALDEAIVNALVHRDYSDFSGEITINIYSDKMEIINSGEIPSDIILRKNTIKPYHSVFRNPTIAHMFFLRGKMEKKGRGLSLIKETFEKNGFKTPEWTTQSGYTTLTLFAVPEKVEINERMIKFLSNIETGNSFKGKEYEIFFADKISSKTARNDISTLVKGKYLIKKGSGPSTKYRRTEKKLPDVTG